MSEKKKGKNESKRPRSRSPSAERPTKKARTAAATAVVDIPTNRTSSRSSWNSSSKIVVAALKWSIKQVGDWACDVIGVDKKYAALLAKQEIDGEALASMTREDFERYGIPGGPA